MIFPLGALVAEERWVEHRLLALLVLFKYSGTRQELMLIDACTHVHSNSLALHQAWGESDEEDF
jgi:hypothetical protein